MVTVDVTMRVGFVHSSSAYAIPFLHTAPATSDTLPDANVTVRGQPIGQLMQVISFFVIFSALSYFILPM
jgi:hypothetical protein